MAPQTLLLVFLIIYLIHGHMRIGKYLNTINYIFKKTHRAFYSL